MSLVFGYGYGFEYGDCNTCSSTDLCRKILDIWDFDVIRYLTKAFAGISSGYSEKYDVIKYDLANYFTNAYSYFENEEIMANIQDIVTNCIKEYYKDKNTPLEDIFDVSILPQVINNFSSTYRDLVYSSIRLINCIVKYYRETISEIDLQNIISKVIELIIIYNDEQFLKLVSEILINYLQSKDTNDRITSINSIFNYLFSIIAKNNDNDIISILCELKIIMEDLKYNQNMKELFVKELQNRLDAFVDLMKFSNQDVKENSFYLVRYMSSDSDECLNRLVQLNILDVIIQYFEIVY